MGRDKALLELGGLTLVARAARILLSGLTDPVKVVGPSRQLAPVLAPLVGPPECSVISDDYPGTGPLGGIASALMHSERRWNLIVACDMPYLTQDWLKYLVHRALVCSADVVLPESDYSGERRPEPLCAVYHQRASAPIRAALERGVRKIMDGLGGLHIERVAAVDSKPFDSEGLLFQNLNTMQDYEAALGWHERMKQH
ncbi:MAG: molybdenum cofactor guanylyltransferase [Acidipila sp.]|nr:molybdenum cofactor guanylyltransferase [Acidipila sp.]